MSRTLAVLAGFISEAIPMFRSTRLLSLLASVALIAACGGEAVGTRTPSGPTQTDSVPPSSPTGLTGIPMGSTGASLSWIASTDNITVTGYIVSRDGAQIATAGATRYVDNGLAPATTYAYAVAALDEAGNLSPNSATVSITTAAAGGLPDTTAPSQPTGLTGTAAGSTGANLSWNASTDNVGVTGYTVNRNGVQIATVTKTSYVDAGLSPATTYSYAVAAFDAAGNRSPNSASVSVTTAGVTDVTPPTQPGSLAGVAAGPTSVNLSWTASTDNVGVTGYIVSRNGVQIATPNSTSFADTGLAPATTYTYTVAARDAAGNKSSTASVSVTTSTATASGTANLAWDPVVAPNLSGYRVYFGTASGAYLQPLGQGMAAGNVTTVQVAGLTNGTRYFFAVTATDSLGDESSFSNEVFKDVP